MLKTKFYICLTFLLFMLLGAAIASAGPVLDESSNRDAVVVIVGQSLELSLECNPSTGYSWQYFPEFAGVGVLEETGHEYRGKSNLIGAPGREYWSFKAISTGNAAISLGYMRPWESRMPEKTFSVDIIITPQVTVQLNGKTLDFNVPPVIKEDRTLAPLRTVAEALGTEVEWLPATRQAIITEEGVTLELTVGSSEALRRDPEGEHIIKLDVPAEIIAGRIFVPLRFFSEALGCQVDWEEATQTVSITG
jgi:predicted secreted protein